MDHEANDDETYQLLLFAIINRIDMISLTYT